MAVLDSGGSQDAIARMRARNTLIRTVRERLKGRGLDIREREHELVISSPRFRPEKGSIHITLSTGEVSYRRTLWDYLGALPGYGPEDPDEPAVDLEAIAARLTGCGQGDSSVTPGPRRARRCAR